MSVVAGSVAAGMIAKGATQQDIIINVLIALSVSAFLVGVFLFSIGALKLGQWLRFIPYPVIGGFLAPSGLLLLLGGMEVVRQSNLVLSASSWQPIFSWLYLPQIAVAAMFALSVPLVGRFVPSFLALPLTFLVYLVALDVVLFVVIDDNTLRNAWFLPRLGELGLWWPLGAVAGDAVDWRVIAGVAVQESG